MVKLNIRLHITIGQNVDVTLHENNAFIHDPISATQIKIRHLAAAQRSGGMRSATTTATLGRGRRSAS